LIYFFNQNQCSIFNFFAKRRLLKDIKNKINSGDWLILNEKDFSPMMSIVDKSVFEAKFNVGSRHRGVTICKIFNRFNIAFFACNLNCSYWFFGYPPFII
jgi:hypothetical protein